MIVKKMLTYNGNAAINQYIVTINDHLKAFQSYDTIIAVYDYDINTLYENDNAWLSKTTNKYYTKFRVYNIPLNPSTNIIKVSDNDIKRVANNEKILFKIFADQ